MPVPAAISLYLHESAFLIHYPNFSVNNFRKFQIQVSVFLNFLLAFGLIVKIVILEYYSNN